MYTHLSRALAAQGIGSARFDFYGNGEKMCIRDRASFARETLYLSVTGRMTEPTVRQLK